MGNYDEIIAICDRLEVLDVPKEATRPIRDWAENQYKGGVSIQAPKLAIELKMK